MLLLSESSRWRSLALHVGLKELLGAGGVGDGASHQERGVGLRCRWLVCDWDVVRRPVELWVRARVWVSMKSLVL